MICLRLVDRCLPEGWCLPNEPDSSRSYHELGGQANLVPAEAETRASRPHVGEDAVGAATRALAIALRHDAEREAEAQADADARASLRRAAMLADTDTRPSPLASRKPPEPSPSPSAPPLPPPGAELAARLDQLAQSRSEGRCSLGGRANSVELRATLQALAELEPADDSVARARAHVIGGDAAAAGTALRRGRASVRDGPESAFVAGVSLALLDRWSEAVDAFRRAVEGLEARGQGTSAAASKAWAALGFCTYMQHGGAGSEEELVAYEHCLRCDESDAVAHINLGVLLAAVRQDSAGAERAYRRALQLDSSSAVAHFNLANLLKERAAELQADERAAVASARGGRTPRGGVAGAPAAEAADAADAARVLRGAASAAAEEAERHYRLALSLEPSYVAAHLNYGHLLYSGAQEGNALFGGRHRQHEAEEHWRAALAIDPSDASARVSLGLLLVDVRGDVAGAEAEYRAALRLNPRLASAHFNLAKLLKNRKGDVAGAEASYRRAISLEPTHAKAYNNLGKLLHETGADLAGAERAYRQALALEPANATVHANLGDLLEARAKAIVRRQRADGSAALPADESAGAAEAAELFRSAAAHFEAAGHDHWADEARAAAAAVLHPKRGFKRPG